MDRSIWPMMGVDRNIERQTKGMGGASLFSRLSLPHQGFAYSIFLPQHIENDSGTRIVLSSRRAHGGGGVAPSHQG